MESSSDNVVVNSIINFSNKEQNDFPNVQSKSPNNDESNLSDNSMEIEVPLDDFWNVSDTEISETDIDNMLFLKTK